MWAWKGALLQAGRSSIASRNSYGFDRWGVCSRIAREIGLSRSSVCRYRKRIFKGLLGR
jgi:hypothetical protein